MIFFVLALVFLFSSDATIIKTDKKLNHKTEGNSIHLNNKTNDVLLLESSHKKRG